MKQILAPLLCAAVVLALFSGCGAAPQTLPLESSPSPQPSPTVAATALPSPTPTDTPSPTPTDAPSPAPTNTVSPTQKNQPLQGLIIGVDAGHQAKANRDKEANAPGSEIMKNKVSSGTRGTQSGVWEHEVNLRVALLLKERLQEAGATVVMIREEADVDISNVERAKIFNEAKVDLGFRIHCDGSENAEKRGAFMMVPKSKEQPFYSVNREAGLVILEEYGKATGLSVEKGLQPRDDQTGFNWCKRPIVAIEMGYMTNADEEQLLIDADFQVKMAQGIFNGILRYFSQE